MNSVDTRTVGAWSLPFIPEKLTPLRLVPSWPRLSGLEQRRYNQLQGLYFHEQIIFFEQRMIVPLMMAAKGKTRDTRLRTSLDRFIAEENAHSAQFHSLLRNLRPEWYDNSWQHFVQIGQLPGAALSWMLSRPQAFPFLIWMVQLLEERTMYASRLYLEAPDSFPAPIVMAQRRHLADEADHVQWDLQLLNEFWPKIPRWLRRLNVRLLNWTVGEFIAVPRRAAVRVLDALAAEIPLSVPIDVLKQELHALADSIQFQQRVFGRDAVPRTWKHAAGAADMAPFSRRWFVHEHTH